MKHRFLQWFGLFCLAFLAIGSLHAQKFTLAVNAEANAQGDSFAQAMEAAGFPLSSKEKLATIQKLTLVSGKFLLTDWTTLAEKLPLCTTLKTFEVKPTVEMESFGESPAPKSYFAATTLEDVHIMSPKFDIPTQMFKGATNLKSITVECAQMVYTAAFEGCTALTTVHLPSATVLCSKVFKGCAQLATLRLPALEDFDPSCSGEAFCEGMTNLTSFYAPRLKALPKNAFKGCEKLTTLDLPACETFDESALEANAHIQHIVAPKLTEVKDKALAQCTALKTFIAPSLKELGSEAFKGCTSLEEVAFPELTDLTKAPFAGCSALKKVTFSLSESISLNEDTFKDCNALTTWVLGALPMEKKASYYHFGTAARTLTLTNEDLLEAIKDDTEEDEDGVTPYDGTKWYGWKVSEKVTPPVRFSVKDKEGESVSNATIKLSQSGTPLATLITGASGEALFIPSVTGEIDYEISAPHGKAPLTEKVDIEDDREEETLVEVDTFEWKMVKVTMPKTIEHGTLIIIGAGEGEVQGDQMTYLVKEGTLLSFTLDPDTDFLPQALMVNNQPTLPTAKYECMCETVCNASFVKKPEEAKPTFKVEVSTSMQNGSLKIQRYLPDGTLDPTPLNLPCDVEENTQLKLTAIPAQGYKLKDDKIDAVTGPVSTPISEASPYTVVDNVKFFADFELREMCSLTVTQTPHGKIEVRQKSENLATSDNLTLEFDKGTRLKITFRPEDGYQLQKFVEVSGTETILSTNPDLTQTIYEVNNASAEIKAYFAPIPKRTLTPSVTGRGKLNIMNEAGKILAPPYAFAKGTKLKLELKPDAGAKADHLWESKQTSGRITDLLKNAEKAVNKVHTLDYTVTESAKLNASFIDDPTTTPQYSVTFSAPEHGSLSVKNGTAEVTSGNKLDANTALTLTVTPVANYQLDKLVALPEGATAATTLLEGGTGVQTATYKLEANVTFTATFKEVKNDPPITTPQYSVTFSAPEHGSLSVKNGTAEVTSGNKLDANTALTLTVTPVANYQLDKLVALPEGATAATTLLEGGTGVQTATYKLEANVTFTATFKEVKNDPPITAPQYTVTFSTPEHGSLSVKNGTAEVTSGNKLDANTVLTLIVTPAANYQLDKLVATVEGAAAQELATDKKGSKEAVTLTYKLEANVTFTATFKKVTAADDQNKPSTPKPSPLSVDEALLAQVTLGPNPVLNVLNLRGLEHVQSVQLLNAQGMLLNTFPCEGTTALQLNVAHLPAGLYFLILRHGAATHTLRFIKR